jgi:voltage-gated potassium channel
VILLEETATDPLLLRVASIVNWVVWVAFCVEYVVRLQLAPSKTQFVRAAWMDLAIIALSPPFLVPDAMEPIKGLRALRLLRFVRAIAVASIGLRHLRGALGHRQFHWVALVASLTVLAGAVAEYAVERGSGGVSSFGDSLWWAVVTATTVGYGDLSPVTTAGRVIAVVLMLVGIGVIGAFTATVASWFVEQGREEKALPDVSELHRRLEVIEAKLDELLQRQSDR